MQKKGTLPNFDIEFFGSLGFDAFFSLSGNRGSVRSDTEKKSSKDEMREGDFLPFPRASKTEWGIYHH